MESHQKRGAKLRKRRAKLRKGESKRRSEPESQNQHNVISFRPYRWGKKELRLNLDTGTVTFFRCHTKTFSLWSAKEYSCSVEDVQAVYYAKRQFPAPRGGSKPQTWIVTKEGRAVLFERSNRPSEDEKMAVIRKHLAAASGGLKSNISAGSPFLVGPIAFALGLLVVLIGFITGC